MRDRHLASSFMVHRRLDVLQQISRAIHIQSLQPVADSEYGLAHVVCVLQQKFVNCVAQTIGSFGLRMARRGELCRVNVGLAARKHHSLAVLDHLHHFRRSAIKGNADRVATRKFDRALILRNCAEGVFGIGAMRKGDRDARLHFSWHGSSAVRSVPELAPCGNALFL